MATETNIRVICRCRPLNDLEKSMGGETCVTLIENTISVRVDPLSQSARLRKEENQNKRKNLYLMK